MSAIVDALPIVGGILGPSGLVWAVIRYIVREALRRADAAEDRADAAELAEDKAKASEQDWRDKANDALTDKARFEAANAGFTQRQADMEAQHLRDKAEIERLHNSRRQP